MTPGGATILAALAEPGVPPMRLAAVGYGIGPDAPRVLRCTVGEPYLAAEMPQRGVRRPHARPPIQRRRPPLTPVLLHWLHTTLATDTPIVADALPARSNNRSFRLSVGNRRYVLKLVHPQRAAAVAHELAILPYLYDAASRCQTCSPSGGSPRRAGDRHPPLVSDRQACLRAIHRTGPKPRAVLLAAMGASSPALKPPG